MFDGVLTTPMSYPPAICVMYFFYKNNVTSLLNILSMKDKCNCSRNIAGKSGIKIKCSGQGDVYLVYKHVIIINDRSRSVTFLCLDN